MGITKLDPFRFVGRLKCYEGYIKFYTLFVFIKIVKRNYFTFLFKKH